MSETFVTAPLPGSPVSLAWRAMRASDLSAIMTAQGIIYPDLQEDRAVFAERLALFPDGCLVLDGGSGPAGYAVSHPWTLGRAATLNTLLGALPDQPSTYYLHDIGLLPSARGSGAGARIVEQLTEVARAAGLATMSLTAVQGSSSYWARHGFAVPGDIPPELASYGDAALFMVRRI